VREGTHVALVSGVPKPLQPVIVRELLSLPQPPPAAQPPIGRVRILEAPAPLENRLDLRGTVRSGAYQSSALSVKAAIPAGFASATDRPSLQLLVVRKEPSLATGAFAFSPEAPESTGGETLHRAAVEGFVAKMPGAPRPRPISANGMHTPMGKGTERTWAIDKSGWFFRTVIVPTCEGLGAYLFTLVWTDEDGRRVLDAWLGSFREDGPRPSAMCKELKRDGEE
jgi:hypothetical protein